MPPAIDTRPAPRWLLLIAGGWGVNEQGAVLAAVAPLSALICALPAVPRAADPQRACPRAAGRKLLGASTRRPRAASQPTLTPSRCPLAAGCRGSCSSMWMAPSSGGLQPAGRGCCFGSWVSCSLQPSSGGLQPAAGPCPNQAPHHAPYPGTLSRHLPGPSCMHLLPHAPQVGRGHAACHALQAARAAGAVPGQAAAVPLLQRGGGGRTARCVGSCWAAGSRGRGGGLKRDAFLGRGWPWRTQSAAAACRGPCCKGALQWF